MKYRRLSAAGDGFYYVESGFLVNLVLGNTVWILKEPTVAAVGSIATVTAIDVPGTFASGPVVSLVGLSLTINVTSFVGTDAQRWTVNTQQPLVQGDMLFGAGDGNFIRNTPDTVAQSVWTRLRLWSGEWFLDLSEGTPYLLGVFGVGGREQLEPIMRDRIRTTPGVLAITTLSTGSDPDARTAFVSAELETIYGAAVLEALP